MRTVVLLLVLVSLSVQPVPAQTVPDSYKMYYYLRGSQTVLTTEAMLQGTYTCNMPDPGTSATPGINPSGIAWDDPANPGKVCIWSAGTTSPMLTLGAGQYEEAITAIAAGIESGQSNRSPFDRVLPNVPTHNHVYRR